MGLNASVKHLEDCLNRMLLQKIVVVVVVAVAVVDAAVAAIIIIVLLYLKSFIDNLVQVCDSNVTIAFGFLL